MWSYKLTKKILKYIPNLFFEEIPLSLCFLSIIEKTIKKIIYRITKPNVGITI